MAWEIAGLRRRSRAQWREPEFPFRKRLQSANGGCDNDHRYFNVTTVRYRIRQAPFADTIFGGMSSAMGANNPLASFHSGGIQACFGDGSVHFISESIDLETLKKLATRDDGQPLGEY